MAGGQYKLLLQADFDDSALQAKIQALQNKSILLVQVKLDPTGTSAVEAEIARLEALSAKVGKITLSTTTGGEIGKAVIGYTDALGNAGKSVLEIKEGLELTQTVTQNLAGDEAKVAAIEEQRAKFLADAAISADKILASSKFQDRSNPTVAAVVNTAEAIKVAVSEGDVAKVKELTDLLPTQTAALKTGRTAWDSWTFGIKNAIKQTIEYAFSVGLVFGALQQLKSGIQFVEDLNKALVNIQVLQQTGAQTNQEIGQLAVQFNNLARSMGATTIEVAQGSTEWLRQGKTIAETQQLLQSTLMLAKLGNMDTATSTNLLTATLNGFNMSADQSVTVVSKLIAIDNIAATSASKNFAGTYSNIWININNYIDKIKILWYDYLVNWKMTISVKTYS